MRKHLNIAIFGLVTVSLILAAGCKREAQSDPVLTYELHPSISLIDGNLNLIPGLSWDNPTKDNYKMVRETLISKNNVNFSRSLVFETSITSNSNGSDETRGAHEGITSAYVLYTLLCEGKEISSEWRKVDAPVQIQE